MLAKKTKFESVLIDFASTDEVDGILGSLATSSNDSLGKVRSFHVTCDVTRYHIIFGHPPHVSESRLAAAIAKCSKLSTLKLDFYVRPLNVLPRQPDLPPCCPMELRVVIGGHALTELNIWLEGYTQQQITQLYQAIQPGILKKIQLYLRNTTLDTGALVTDLVGAWKALEEIELDLDGIELQMDQLFPSLARLPNLRKCHIMMSEINSENLLVDILNSLFGSDIQMTLRNGREAAIERGSIHGDGDFELELGNYASVKSGSETVALIRHVQDVHPDLQVGFGADGQRLMLTLGRVTFEHFSTTFMRWTRPCQDGDCADCGLLYPTVIRKLIRRGWQRMHGVQDAHLTNCRLDRCRVQRAVADLNAMGQFVKADRLLRAVSAELDEEENLVRSHSNQCDPYSCTLKTTKFRSLLIADIAFVMDVQDASTLIRAFRWFS